MSFGRQSTLMERGRVLQLMGVMADAGAVTPHARDDIEATRRFKYACGRNFTLLERLGKGIQADVHRMMAASGELDAFAAEQEQLLEAHCKRWPEGHKLAGEPILRTDKETGREYYTFDPDKEATCQDAVGELARKYAGALAERDAQQAAAAEYLRGLVGVELFTCSWADVPVGMHGGFMDAVREMIRDVPAEFDGEGEGADGPNNYVDGSPPQ